MFGSIALVVLVANSDSKSEANLTVATFDTSLCRREFDILVRYPRREQLIGENGAPILDTPVPCIGIPILVIPEGVPHNVPQHLRCC